MCTVLVVSKTKLRSPRHAASHDLKLAHEGHLGVNAF